MRPGGLARLPAVLEPVNNTVVMPGPERKTNWERFTDGTAGFAANTAVALERLGQIVALVKPTAQGFNTAEHPVVTCVFLLVALYGLLGYGLGNRAIDLSFNKVAAERTAGLIEALTPRCTNDDHVPSCQRLDALLHLNHSSFQNAPEEADPPPTDEPRVCWKAGPAIRKAGAAGATELTVVQTAAAYGEVVRPLPAGWLLRTDL